MEIHKKIKEARINAGLTQEQVAEKIMILLTRLIFVIN